MATTRIIPLHAGKGRTVGKAISDIIDYVKNPEKTDHSRLITSYQCDSRVADAQFLLDKQTYAARTGRVRGADDVIAYHLRQSFVPGEITPEEANRLGVELARRFTKGKHACPPRQSFARGSLWWPIQLLNCVACRYLCRCRSASFLRRPRAAQSGLYLARLYFGVNTAPHSTQRFTSSRLLLISAHRAASS